MIEPHDALTTIHSRGSFLLSHLFSRKDLHIVTFSFSQRRS